MKLGDPLPEPRLERKKRIAKLFLPVVLLATLSATGFNSLIIFGVVGPTQFTGQSLFSISVQYAYGAAPSGSVLLPGDSVDFTLSINNNARSASQLQIWFEATNPSDRAWTCFDSAFSYPGTFTMTLSQQSQPVSPINTLSPHDCFGSRPLATFSMEPGLNVVTGTISVASTAVVGDSFSLSWFGQPV